ncbi:VCBS repeat-containing protein [Glycomyces luteolus]|uniref:VCBS repeat-containing protein n=1 Tax=Glycomyces luteolus TaxID=2670330 RepID=A0A9X3P987_9ACTN|nr:VCBS repeat-containing protein [Glycomyces luteolus]MDA1361143.1 VCBS repeat-containing protein [Glycomyces luteolus]
MEDSAIQGRLARIKRRYLAWSIGIASIAVLIAPNATFAQSATDGTAAPEQVPSGNYDYDGDGLSDVVARRDATGALEIWPGNGSGSFDFNAKYTVGLGWNAMNLIETAGDLNSDGNADIIAREASTGRLYFYPGNGSTFAPFQSIGRGWNVMSAIVSGHDYTGDGHVDIIAVEGGTGTLWLYPGTGTGTAFAQRLDIGSSWNLWHDLTAVGDTTEDGYADINAVRNSEDAMYFFAGPGSEKFEPGVRFDWGWDVLEQAAAVGDFTGDGHLDWVAKDPDHNHLYLFHGDGTGRYDTSPVIDYGWNSMTIA